MQRATAGMRLKKEIGSERRIPDGIDRADPIDRCDALCYHEIIRIE